MRILEQLRNRFLFHTEQAAKCQTAIELIETEMGDQIAETKARKINGALKAHTETWHPESEPATKPRRKHKRRRKNARMTAKQNAILALLKNGPMTIREMQPQIEELRGGPTTADSISVTCYSLARKGKVMRGGGNKGVVGLPKHRAKIAKLDQSLQSPSIEAMRMRRQKRGTKRGITRSITRRRQTPLLPSKSKRGRRIGTNILHGRDAKMTIDNAILTIVNDGPKPIYQMQHTIEELRGAKTTRGTLSVAVRDLKRKGKVIGGKGQKGVYGLPGSEADILTLEASIPAHSTAAYRQALLPQ